MPSDTSSRQNEVATREKVAKLSAFIAADLDARSLGGLQTTDCYLVVARSPRSPVAQALRTNAAKIATSSIMVRAIFSEIDPIHAEDLTGPFAMPGACRVVRDPRLLAAHEQLVLASNSAWIGDSMRREPSKRDTYEHFGANSAETVALATRSFERLWRTSVAVRPLPALPAGLASQLPGLAADQVAGPEFPRRQ